MENIANLMKATPNIFENIHVFTDDQFEQRDVKVECLVHPDCDNEDEIYDMFQAILDVCQRILIEENKKIIVTELKVHNMLASSPKDEFIILRKAVMTPFGISRVNTKIEYYDFNNELKSYYLD